MSLRTKEVNPLPPLALKAKAMARGEGHEIERGIFVDCETAEALDPEQHARAHARRAGLSDGTDSRKEERHGY